ncbi:MAG: S1 RNA-binding domain-containing protein [Oscillospiraceae bacterium]|nr:S1 RNA-binding domain-containing protein [Oscillospiraceae bacterium]
MERYLPEGCLWNTTGNTASLKSVASLQESCREGKILEGRVILCDSEHNLIVDLISMKGIIPKPEGAIGIQDGSTKDIALISRVNKVVCFRIQRFDRGPDGEPVAILSRRQVQEECMDRYVKKLHPGDIIPVRVTHLEPFGAFVDIGCGIPSLIPIDAISVSRISHPRDRFYPGQKIRAIVRQIEPGGRVSLSHKELLGSWEENAALFSPGETVAGVIRSSESYGVFIELTPNLAGLAEPRDDVLPGQHASVFIKSLIPEKMKVKLILVDAFDASYPIQPFRYFVQGGHLSHWRYSPSACSKQIETVFEDRQDGETDT